MRLTDHLWPRRLQQLIENMKAAFTGILTDDSRLHTPFIDTNSTNELSFHSTVVVNLSSSRGSLVKAMDLRPANLGSTPAGTVRVTGGGRKHTHTPF